MLTPRENQILSLKAIGFSDKEIGCQLAISIETVKKTVCNIKERIRLWKVTELVAWWHCNRIGEDFIELKKRILSVTVSLVLLFATCLQVVKSDDVVRLFRARAASMKPARAMRRQDELTFDFDIAC